MYTRKPGLQLAIVLASLFLLTEQVAARPEEESTRSTPAENEKAQETASEESETSTQKVNKQISQKVKELPVPFSEKAGEVTEEFLEFVFANLTLEMGVQFRNTEFYSKYSGPFDAERFSPYFGKSNTESEYRYGGASGMRSLYQITSTPINVFDLQGYLEEQWSIPYSIRLSYSLSTPRTVRVWLNGYPSNTGYDKLELEQMFLTDNYAKTGVILRATEAVYRESHFYLTLYPIYMEWHYISFGVGIAHGQSLYSLEIYDYQSIDGGPQYPFAVRISDTRNVFRPLTITISEVSIHMNRIFPESEIWDDVSVHLMSRNTGTYLASRLNVSPWVFRDYDPRKDFPDRKAILVPPEELYIRETDFSISFRKQFQLY